LPILRQFLVLILLAGAFAVSLEAQPVRLSLPAFGTSAEVEVRDLRTDLGESAAREALEEIFAIERLTDPASELAGGLGRLNAAAGQGPQVVDPRLVDMLARARGFCIWSGGAHGPLGGELYALWRASQHERGGVDPALRRLAVERAACSRLGLEVGEPTTVELAEGSRLDLWGFAQGYAADRAMDIVRRHGAGNAIVKVGQAWRAVGGGPDGEGWYVALPPAEPGSGESIDEIWLRDRALAVVTAAGRDLDIFVPILDQRTGRPGSGVIAVAVATELAVDAYGMAPSLYILGLRRGQRELGQVRPRPSVLWLLGEGGSEGVASSYRWSEVAKVR